jgi:hypothetical protein
MKTLSAKLKMLGHKKWNAYWHIEAGSIEIVDRYSALGIPAPDPETMCDGQCEGTGFIPIYMSIGDEELPELSHCHLADEDDPALVTLWEAEEANHPCRDGWHFIECPDCQGTGKKLGELAASQSPAEGVSERCWISPAGGIYPVGQSEYHGAWVIENYEWLKSQNFLQEIPDEGDEDYPEGHPLRNGGVDYLKSIKGRDFIRNILIEEGWVATYNAPIAHVWKLDDSTQHLLAEWAHANKFDYSEDKLEVEEIGTGKRLEIDPLNDIVAARQTIKADRFTELYKAANKKAQEISKAADPTANAEVAQRFGDFQKAVNKARSEEELQDAWEAFSPIPWDEFVLSSEHPEEDEAIEASLDFDEFSFIAQLETL